MTRFAWLRAAPSTEPTEWPWYVRWFAKIEYRVRRALWLVR